MGDCIDLTLDSDDEAPPAASRHGNSKRIREQTASDSSDVVVVEDEPGREAHSKRPRAAEPAAPAGIDEEVIVTAECGDDPMRDYPHGRPQCRVHKLSKGTSVENSKACANCYCFVCDKKASECQFWGSGARQRDHCNAHISSYWDALRKAARMKNLALLEREFSNAAPQLSTNFSSQNPAAAAAAAAATGSSRPRSSTGGQVSPAVLWARKATAAVQHSEALLHGRSGAAATAAAGGSGVAPAAAGGSGVAAAAAGNGSGPTSLKNDVKPPTPPLPQPQRPAASVWLERMPYPSSSNMQHIATLELPIRTAKGVTISELQKRLVPCGFYKGVTGRAPEYGDHVCLDNIASTRFNPDTRKSKHETLRLLPLVPPGGLPTPPDSKRTWKLIVASHDASVRPQSVTVTVERGCKLSELSAALVDKLQSMGGSAALKPSEELMFAALQADCHVPRLLRDPSQSMSDSLLLNKLTFFAFKVPKGLLNLAPYSANSSSEYYNPRTKVVLVIHERTINLRDNTDSDRDSDSGEDGCSVEDDEDLYLRINSVRGPKTKVVHLGLPQLMVINDNHLRGGSAADSAVKKNIAAQLNLYCRAGSPQHSVHSWPFELQRRSQQILLICHSRTAQDARFSKESALQLECCDTPGVAMLYAHWGAHATPPAGFDLEAFNSMPPLTDATDLQRYADLPKVLKSWEEYQADMKLLSTLPQQVINDLRQACNATAPPRNDHEAAVLRPSAAAVLSIIPADNSSNRSCAASSSSAAPAATGNAAKIAAAADADAALKGIAPKQYSSERLGVLRVEVYIFKQAGRHHRLLAEDCDHWEMRIPSAGRGRNFRHGSCAGCPLNSVMNARLLQEQSGYELLREIEKLKTANVHGIAKLMDWLKTGERAAAPQPAGLRVQLHPYQLQALSFMIDAERMEGGWRQLLWQWVTPTPQQQQQPVYGQQQQQQVTVGERGKGVWWSPVLDRLSYSVPPAPWGGFLAEEMGLGKTVEVLGLVLSNPAPSSVVSGCFDSETGKLLSRATLVVCAVSLVGQWCEEAKNKLADNVRMYAYHGSNRVRDPLKLATNYDLVVTTYQTLGSDYGGKAGNGTRSPCHKIKWHRVVFDEGHMVKNGSAVQSKASVNIAADRRWVCTGTPVNNDIGDLLGQFAVLQMQPLSNKTFFDGRVKPAFTSPGYGLSCVPLLYTLRHTMVRHTKAQHIAGQNVLSLPQKTEELVPVTLSADERRAYLDAHSKAAALWAAVRHFSPSEINKMLLQIMALLLPLRRICSGGLLMPSDLALPQTLELAVHMHQGYESTPGAAAAAGGPGRAHGNVNIAEDSTIEAPEALECPICLDNFECPVMTPCHHWFCKECILGVLDGSTHCPLCRNTVDALGLRAPGKNNQATPVVAMKKRKRRSPGDTDGEDEDEEYESVSPEDAAEQQQQQARGADGSLQLLECESKLQALLAELAAMRQADPSSKALVFSQYNSTLEWLKRKLPQKGFGFRTITGSMAQRQRAKAIMAFQADPPTTVFLLSMRSGAVGINLTAASHVFLLEPCLNPALEEQAIGRAWRMGQTRPVTVKRFYVKGSIEERIMDVRSIRQGHASHSAAATAAAATAGAGSSNGAGTSAAAAAGGETPAAATPVTPAAAAAAAVDNDDDDPVTRRGKQRLKPEVLAGNLTADKQVLKIAELDLLFRTPELDESSSIDGAGSSAAAAAMVAAGTPAAAAPGQAAAARQEMPQNMEL